MGTLSNFEQIEKILVDLQDLVSNLMAVVNREKQINNKLKAKLNEVEGTIEIMNKRLQIIEEAAKREEQELG